jgi:hypothetical protein
LEQVSVKGSPRSYEILRLESMRAETVSFVPRCAECCAAWFPADEARWRAYWIDDGPEEKLLFYCPNCAEREFGDN